MKKSLQADVRGLAVVAIIIVVVVMAGLGGVGYLVWTKGKKGIRNAATNAISQAVSQANCEYDDKDLCKFFASWKETKFFKATTESVSEGTKSSGLFEMVLPDKMHVKTEDTTAYEMISIGDASYIYDASDGKWLKTVIPKARAGNPDFGIDQVTFEEPKKDAAPEKQTQYKALGKEACGSLQCFKYQVIEPGAEAGTAEYIWFDTKDYQLRRSRSEDKSGYNDMTISYDKVEINEPSPVKEAAVTSPADGMSEADRQRLIEEASGTE